MERGLPHVLEFPGGKPTSLRTQARFREQMWQTALAFEQELSLVAKNSGLVLPSPAVVSPDSASLQLPFIASGHQAVVYHPGLVEKELQAVKLAKDFGGIPLTFILDTDPCDDGLVSFPLIDTSKSTPAELTTSIYAHRTSGREEQQILAAQQRIGVEPWILSEHSRPLAEQQRNKHAEALALYRKLDGVSSVVAHVIVRRMLGCPAVLQVPFSRLFAAQDLRSALFAICARPATIQGYNQALSEYRVRARIKNPANPFPNLLTSELPLWQLDGTLSQRTAVSATDQPPASTLLVPRGAFVSIVLRAWLCDLFIHGLGGKEYEPAAESVAHTIASELTLAPYAVASANRYPYEALIAEYEILLNRQKLLRSAPSHLEPVLKAFAGSWSEDQLGILHSLARQKQELLAELQETKRESQGGMHPKSDRAPRTTQEIGTAIKRVDNQLRELVEQNAAVALETQRLTALSSVEALLYKRAFPFWI